MSSNDTPFNSFLFGPEDIESNENGGIISILPDEFLSNHEKFPDILSILPLRNTVLFPGVVLPISVGRKQSLKLLKSLKKDEINVGIVSQKDSKIENPKFEDIYQVGTIARILKIFEMPDGTTTAVIQGRKRFDISEQITDKPHLTAKYILKNEIVPENKTEEFEAMIQSVKELSVKIIELSSNLPKEAAFAVRNIDKKDFLINFVASNSDIENKEKQRLLEIDDLYQKAEVLLEYLSQQVQKLELKDNIQNKVRFELNQQQREYFLNQQIKAIQDELGTNSNSLELEEIDKRAEKKKWSKEVGEVFKKQRKRIQQMNQMSPDYSIQLTYLQNFIDLPWGIFTKDNYNLKRAQEILDKDHYGLEKVKDRILEHLAVLKLKGDLKAPILCLYGPPGVGKTSLGQSIATALGRKYVRISLGGLHDEAEIRGHRKTYIGAMPGRIIQSLNKAQSSNPVFILDEIDKVGNDFRGDPSSALLEVLDPQQNSTFYDNYMEVEFDLSKILFIATANSVSNIKPALRDRMELINVSGYVEEEKVEIAKRHLIQKQLKDHGLNAKQLIFSKEAVEEIVAQYTRESGVRALNLKIAEIVRKIAKKIAFDENYEKNLKRVHIKELLGVPKFQREKYDNNEFAGVVTGLAWTTVGGTILVIETSLSKGNGRLTLTGNLGEVMKESAIIALEYIKSRASDLQIDESLFNLYNIHIHVPEGAVPKDGPSAGITMATAMVSVFTQRKVRKNLAMTGEITLRGKVLPVGGIKEKILAAKRAEIKEIILSKENKKDIEEINELYLKGLEFHYVETVNEVFEIAVLKQKVKNPKKIEIKAKGNKEE